MHKFKSVEKFSFKEKRFLNIFEGTKAFSKKGLDKAGKVVDEAKSALNGAPAAPAPAPAAKLVARSSQPPSVEAPDVGEPAQPEVVDRKTGDFSELQNELSGKLKETAGAPPLKNYLDEVEKVSGIEFQRVVNVSTPNFDALKSNSTNGLYEAILNEFTAKNANFSGFAKFLGIMAEAAGTLEKDVKMIVSMALANSFVKKAKADFAVKYAHLTAFLAIDAGKAFAEENIEAKFIYNATGGVSVELAGGRKFEAAYAEFAKTQPADGEGKPEEKAKEDELPTRGAKLQCMENSKIGKLLKMFGVKFEEVLDAKSPFAALAFVMLGFGGKLGLGDSDMFDGLPETGLTTGLKKTFDQLKVAARKSGYGIDKDPIDYAKLNLTPLNYEAFDDKFVDTVKNAKVLDPAKDGIKLEKAFNLGVGANPANVKVDLTDGGEIVVNGGTADAGVKLMVNDKEISVVKGTVTRLGKETADGDIKATNGVAVLTGVIPAGTVFTKKCKLSEAKVEVAATE